MELDELSIGQSSAVRIACYGNYRTEDAYMGHPEQARIRGPSCLRSTHVMREFILEVGLHAGPRFMSFARV